MRHERFPLPDRCRGRWRDILLQLGAVDAKLLDKKHHPCPWCGGKDRFRWTDHEHRGGFFCNQCGSGDGVDLVMRAKGLSLADAAREIERVLGSTREHVDEAPAYDRSAALNRLWNGAQPLQEGDTGDAYLTSRLGCRLDPWPPALRCATSVDYWHDSERRGRYPALLAKVTGAEGKPCQISKTYLDGRGGKADVPEPKKLCQGNLPAGSAVRLFPPREGLLGVGEGLETSLAAHLLHEAPVWSCLTAGNLEKFEPPASVRRLIVFGDNDPNFTGQAAAYALANRMARKEIEVDVRIPDRVKDWADALEAQHGEASP